MAHTPIEGFLTPVRVLSRLVEGIFIDLLGKKRPDIKAILPKPKKNTSGWCAQCIDYGVEHLLAYLGRYVHRIAVSNNRIIATILMSYSDTKTARPTNGASCA